MVKITPEQALEFLKSDNALQESLANLLKQIQSMLASGTPVPTGLVTLYNAGIEQGLKNTVNALSMQVDGLFLFLTDQKTDEAQLLPVVLLTQRAKDAGFVSSPEEISFVSSAKYMPTIGDQVKQLGSTPYFNPKFRGSWRGPASGGTETAKMTGYRLSSGNLLMQNFDQKGVKYRVAGGDLNGLGSLQSEAAEVVAKAVRRGIGVRFIESGALKYLIPTVGGVLGIYIFKKPDIIKNQAIKNVSDEAIAASKTVFKACVEEAKAADTYSSGTVAKCSRTAGIDNPSVNKRIDAINRSVDGWGLTTYLVIGVVALGAGYYIYRKIQVETDPSIKKAEAEAKVREERRDDRRNRATKGLRTRGKSSKKAG